MPDYMLFERICHWVRSPRHRLPEEPTNPGPIVNVRIGVGDVDEDKASSVSRAARFGREEKVVRPQRPLNTIQRTPSIEDVLPSHRHEKYEV